jgi:sugar phosphate isomerase/epimerase
MKLGAMDNVIKGSNDAERFAKAASIGLAGIEINLPVAECGQPDHPRIAELLALSEEYSVTICSTVLGEHNSGGLATWWRGEEADAEVRRAVDRTAALGAPLMLLPFFFFNEPKGSTHRQAVVERLKPLARYAEDRDVVIAYEGVTPAAQLAEMIDAVGSPAMGVYYDVANMTWCDADPATEVRLLGDRIRQIHIKEARTFTGDARPGAGRVDWVAYRDALASIGFDGWMVLESPAAEPEVLRQDQRFVRRIFGDDVIGTGAA